jgi:hypothetical protein
VIASMNIGHADGTDKDMLELMDDASRWWKYNNSICAAYYSGTQSACAKKKYLNFVVKNFTFHSIWQNVFLPKYDVADI